MATISKTNGKIVSKIKYKGEIYDAGGSGGNTLKTLLDATQSTYYLFNHYRGASVDNLISYNDTSSVTDMRYMFSYCSYLTTIPQLDTSSVTDMRYMFEYCSNLTTIPQLDTSSVTDMSNMFSYCSNLTTIPQLDISKVTTTNSMFYYCSNLTTIPQLDTSSVTDMRYMFAYCEKLPTIDITHMNITSTSNNSFFAAECYSLTKLIIRNMSTIPTLNSNAFTDCYHFDGTRNSTYNPGAFKDGRIYVPDDKVDALKTATNWSVYADIIVPLSTLVE